MRTKKGVVTSAKMQGTVTVTVTRSVMHPIYRKRFPRSKKFLADTDGKKINEGDLVVIGETRPVSKYKRFKVLEIVGRKESGAATIEEEVLGDALLGDRKNHASKEKESEPSPSPIT